MRLQGLLLILGSASTIAAQTTQSPTPPHLKLATTGVVIDVIATDKEGRPVLDLTGDDFEVREDKVLQQIQLCTLIGPAVPSRTAGAPTAEGSTPTAQRSDLGASADGLRARIPPPDGPTVTALLFDRLSHETRPMAVRAALEFVTTMAKPRDRAGVFIADLAFHTLQPLTDEEPRLVAALQRVLTTAPTNLRPEDQLRSKGVEELDPTTSPTANAEASGGSVTPLERERRLKAMDPGQRALIEMEYRMEQSYGRMLTEMQGQATVAGLRAAVAGLSLAPGRKSLIYFSPEVVITARTKSLFDRLIQEANHANVTVYTIDSAGLRAHSAQQELGRKAAVAGAQGVGDVAREDGTPWTRELEMQEQALSSGTGPMARISRETGGFLLENTNNLAAGMRRIQQERTNYYLLLYESTNTRHDGTYRKVSVKVKRTGIRISARRGYIAPS